MSAIYVLHENNEWVEPLRHAFAERDLPYREWFLDEGSVPFDNEPPDGVFYNRMSASAHTRGHRFGPELAHLALNWLELHGRRVVNGTRALYLEISKLAQYAALNRAGIRTPRTVAAVGREAAISAVRDFGAAPWVLKPNRGGKGLGVRVIGSFDELTDFFDSASYETPVDGAWLIQEYIRPAQPFITRCEFVGGKFLYAVRVDTRNGFQLCPADGCTPLNQHPPVWERSAHKFLVVEDMKSHPIVKAYERFLRQNDIEIAGIEFIIDGAGDIYTYDVNTNTNYNRQAEQEAKLRVTGMGAIARFLGKELSKIGGGAVLVQ